MPNTIRLFIFLTIVIFAMNQETPAQRKTAPRARPTPEVKAVPPEVTYSVSMSKPWTHLLEVEMNVKWAQMPQTTELKLPVWTPGSYLVREYARHVQNFSAKDQSGADLTWTKSSKNTWAVQTTGAKEFTARYMVYSNELTVRTNEVNDEHAFWNNTATLSLVFVGRIIGGITGGNISTAQAYIADVTSRENRAKGMGLFGAAFGLGFVFGPAIAGVLSKFGVHVPFFVAAALSLVNAIALYLVLPESLSAEARAQLPVRKSRIRQMVESLSEQEFREINIIYFLLVTAFSIVTYAFVLYTAFRFGYTPEQNGYLFAFIGIIAIVAQGVLFGRLVARFGESALVVAGCLMMAASLFAFPFIGHTTMGAVMLIAGTAALALGNSLASPALTSLASKTAGEHEQGTTLGILQSGASLARVIGPVLGGFLLNNGLNLIDDDTLYRTFWAAAFIMMIALGVAVYFSRNRRTGRMDGSATS